MKLKIELKRIFHRNEWRYAIIFPYDRSLTNLVKSINKAAWSQTNGCWHTPADENSLKQILTVFRDYADIDISAIVSGEKKNEAHADKIPRIEDETKPVSPPVIKDETVIPENDTLSLKQRKKSSGFDAVLFTLQENDGRLIIKFTGNYDPEWIKEMHGYGRPYYDSRRNEWLLRWSKMTVDSLSDYFSERGVEVIVKKKPVPGIIKERRSDLGGDVRDRTINDSAMEGIEAVRRHLEEKRYSRRTTEAYLSHLGLFFKYFHDKDPHEINETDISQFMEEYIIRLGYSSSYQNLIISAIKMYYSLSGLRRPGQESFERPRRSRALPKVFSKEEIKKILNASRNNKHKLLLMIIYSCGLRRSEVINIRLADLDRQRSILNIIEGKGNVDRIVPVSEKVWARIDEYISAYKPEKYLFEGQSGGKYSAESVYNVFKQAMKSAGIEKDVGVHSLRHSYATHLHESGLDIRYIQELLGHKTSRTTEIYTHVSRRNLVIIRSPIEDIDI